MKRKRKIHEIDSTNDIRYRGPLTYQQFRMLGWLCIAVSQVAVLLAVAQSIFPERFAKTENLRLVLSMIGNVAMPLLLIANFAVILSSREGYKKLLTRFGALSAGAVAAFFLLYERYIIGFFAVGSTRAEAHAYIDSHFFTDGFIAFNLFLDLFLCTLVMFFLDYNPKKHFKGKKLLLFRLFALIPIIYEAVSVLLKILASLGRIKLPVESFPFLTTKPPIGFAVFVALALFIKRRERKFLKNGKTLKDYKSFLRTNANSWHFSVHAAIIMAVAAIIDLTVIVVYAIVYSAPLYGTEMYEPAMYEALYIIVKSGFGSSLPLIIIAPFMLLFSYNRKPKRPQIDRYVPIGGVALIIIIYIEGIFYGLKLFG